MYVDYQLNESDPLWLSQNMDYSTRILAWHKRNPEIELNQYANDILLYHKQHNQFLILLRSHPDQGQLDNNRPQFDCNRRRIKNWLCCLRYEIIWLVSWLDSISGDCWHQVDICALLVLALKLYGNQMELGNMGFKISRVRLNVSQLFGKRTGLN